MASHFYKLGGDLTGASGLSFRTQIKYFRSYFTVNPHTCHVLWLRIKVSQGTNVQRHHLLWGLYFLSKYPRVLQLKKIFGVSIKTFRKHAFHAIRRLAELKIVRFLLLYFYFII